jgi:hypothetical protein
VDVDGLVSMEAYSSDIRAFSLEATLLAALDDIDTILMPPVAERMPRFTTGRHVNDNIASDRVNTAAAGGTSSCVVRWATSPTWIFLAAHAL